MSLLDGTVTDSKEVARNATMSEKQGNVDKETSSLSQTEEEDEELNELLNSALDDFGKPLPAAVAAKTESEVDKKEDSVLDDKWAEEFIKQAAAHFELSMKSILTPGGEPSESLNPDDLEANLQKIADAATKAMSDEKTDTTISDGDFAATISQTLKNLSEGAENLQAPMSNEELMNMFSGLSMGDGAEGDIIPFMQQMMQSLLSKDILYPALKDIVDKYPQWLEENRTKLKSSEYERFNKQHTLMEQVCSELEAEKETDSSELKKQRFDKILDLMQKMQECGHPPQELVGDLGSVVVFDEQGNPRLPPGADVSQCAIM